MAAFTFNQANGTLLSAISATWAGDVSTLEVQSSQLQVVGGNAYSLGTAYLNEGGSSYAVAKYPAGQSNQFNTFIRSTSGVYTSGYAFLTSSTIGNLYRNNTFVNTYTLASSHNASTTATEIRIEQVGADVKVYGGPIGGATLIGTYTDGTPLSGGYSGFFFAGNGTVTPGITYFDNGVSGVTYTYARPASDITTQWTPSTGTDHYALIDETTADDTDYLLATGAGQVDEVKLASMTAPKAGTSLAINYRVQNIVGSASVTVSLVCNTTVIATDSAKSAPGDYTLTVSAATWSASVTDWTNMRLRFTSA